jgi:hypothetical protein
MSFNPQQIRIGAEVEREHTDDPAKARQIAKDHLRENPRYYPTGKRPKGKKEALRYESIMAAADRFLPRPINEAEFLTLEANPPDAPGAAKLVADDGRSILFQTDWDWPSLARNFGWSTEHVSRRSTLDFNGEKDIPCPGSDQTDGTVKCPGCGKPASSFIYEARQFLDDHDGATCENPGYTLDELEQEEAPSPAPPPELPRCPYCQGQGEEYGEYFRCKSCQAEFKPGKRPR